MRAWPWKRNDFNGLQVLVRKYFWKMPLGVSGRGYPAGAARSIDIMGPPPKYEAYTVTENSTRNYRKEYDNYHSSAEQKKDRAGRNAARSEMVKAGKARKGDGKDVDHKNRNPRSNGPGNLRVQSRSENRSRNSVLGRRKTILG